MTPTGYTNDTTPTLGGQFSTSGGAVDTGTFRARDEAGNVGPWTEAGLAELGQATNR